MNIVINIKSTMYYFENDYYTYNLLVITVEWLKNNNTRRCIPNANKIA